MAELIDRLFVYGTLRAGESARALFADRIARSARASIAGAMYILPSGYAGVIDTALDARVIGELVWLTDVAATLALLDDYEGDDYRRVIRDVAPDGGEPIASWIYVLADPALVERGSLVEHGDWARYRIDKK